MINAPAGAVYAQWRRFDEFPLFMEDIERVEEVGPVHVRFVAHVLGRRRTWLARIVEDRPHAVEWVNEEGPKGGGRVRLEPQGPNRTMVRLHLEYEPQTLAERTSDALGLFEARIEGDLRTLKQHIERQRQLGRVPGGTVGGPMALG